MAWDSETSYALGLYRKLGKILGTWPLDSKSIFSNVRLAFTCMCINFVNQLLWKGACGTITELVDIISMFSCGCSLLIKLTVLIIHQDEISIIVNSTVKDWSDIIDHESRSIMLRYAKIGRRVFISQAVCYISSALSLIYTRFPSVEYIQHDRSNYSVTTIGVPLWPDCWAVADISINHYMFLFIFHGQFHVLSASFNDFSECSNNEYYTHHQLVKLVERHRHLLKMANGFEDIYNLLILIHVGLAIMIICVSGIVLLISLHSSNFAIVVDMASRILVTYFQLFMYCYTGEQLRTEAMNIKNVIYNSPWFKMHLSTVKNMIFIIMRSDYPVNLTAGKIYEMNVPNFLTIVKTITSYFSVIRLAFKEHH
ncbi:hypothetical protein PV327_001044 [Microctonus hyperodae]|uniref:Odorant receptor n=1 Tax=Microctonus hyperodae TaxID=165561 RepID=A0AA39L2T5_MICHY|nr:hypothetical protein PV327_001044 [Microctonus hyperodae]